MSNVSRYIWWWLYELYRFFFFGCHRCSLGKRTYHPDCALYYCNDCEYDTNTDTSADADNHDDDDSISHSSDSGDSDIGDSGTVYSAWVYTNGYLTLLVYQQWILNIY